MSNREPMWYCHECHAEMRPLMVPDPHCASCNGTFVEKLENSEDDPRQFQHVHDGIEDDALPENMDGFLTGLRTLMRGYGPREDGGPDPTPAAHRSRSEGPPNRPDRMGFGEGNGLTIRIQNSSDGRASTMIIGGPPRGGGPGNADNVPPLFSEFLSRGSGGQDGRQDRHPISGPLMAQYLLAMLSNRPGQGGESANDIFGGLFGMPEGAESGRWGDYVFNQEALDQIISQIMENSNAHNPVPATEDIMNNLPRNVIEEGSDLLDKDCAVCKEQFKLDVEDDTERIVVSLPCKHIFHEQCILPWLKTSGTCPVCRYQLVPQPSPQAPGPGPPGGSGSGTGRPSSPDDHRRGPSSPGGRGSYSGSGFLGGLFGRSGGGGSDRNGPSGGSQNSGFDRSSNRRQRSDDANIPGGWGDQLD